VQLQLIVALSTSTTLTLTLVLAEVLVMRHELILVIDANQGISGSQLLVELFLG